jgi:hypothetical protein
VTERVDMNSLIRAAARGTQPSNALHLLPQAPPAGPPVGRSSIGHGSPSELHVEEDSINDRIRRQWAVMRGHVDLGALGNW